MTDKKEVTPLQKKVLASLGRNVLHFQRVEAQLKRLVLLCDFAASRSELATRRTKRVAELRMTTMGNLVKALHQHLYGKPAEVEIQESITEVFVRFQLRVDADPNYVVQQKKMLSDLVLERNHLIHQDLAEFDPDSEESCRLWITRLNEQNERILAQHQELKVLLDTHNEAAKHMLAFMESDEYRRKFSRDQNKSKGRTTK